MGLMPLLEGFSHNHRIQEEGKKARRRPSVNQEESSDLNPTMLAPSSQILSLQTVRSKHVLFKHPACGIPL